MLNTGARLAIAEVLNRAPFVRWDRFTVSPDDEVNVYGWIDRDDGRSDFVLVEFDITEPADLSYGWTSSSAEFSEELGRLLYGEGFDGNGYRHLACQRVESELLGVENPVRL